MAALLYISSVVLLIVVKQVLLVDGLDNNRIYNCYEEFCHQHSNSCSQKTTFCRYCRDNTYGPYCNFCQDGFYGNATASKYGCKRCPCPFIKSNGTCMHNKTDNSFKCLKCLMGYHGQLCDQCDKGYYKISKSGLCVPCDCNNHGNSSLVQQCEPVGGRCFQCFDKTAGMQCEQCIDGYYKLEKNNSKICVRCNCNGNSQSNIFPICRWRTGVCTQCTYNTTGDRCEKCAQGYRGDALFARNCTLIPLQINGKRPYKKRHVVVALVTSLAIIVAGLIALSIFIWWKRRKTRDPLGFVTINMNHADEDDYNIAWIDPVTGDPIRHMEVDTEMPLANGNLELIDDDDVVDTHDALGDEYQAEDGDNGEFESRDTDRML